MPGLTGTATTTHRTPASAKRRAQAQAKQEDRWASQSGKVRTRTLTPAQLQRHLQRLQGATRD